MIERAMSKKGITGVQLAKKLNISPPSVHAIVTGKSLPRRERIDQLAKVLDFNDVEKIKFRVAYGMAKGRTKNSIGRIRGPVLDKIKASLEEKGLHPTSPYQELGDPDLYFEHGGQRYGVLMSKKMMDWDRVLGMSQRISIEKGLDRILFIFAEDSGMIFDPTTGEAYSSPKEIFKLLKIQVVSEDGLATFELES